MIVQAIKMAWKSISSNKMRSFLSMLGIIIGVAAVIIMMSFENIKEAVTSIFSNKMRSILTMLGIIIGVMSLVVLVSLVSGTTDSVTDQISSMGSNLLTVTISDDKGNPLKLDDVAALADEEEIEMAAPVSQSSVTAESTYSEEDAVVYGTTGAYYDIQNLELYTGRFLKNVDVQNHSNVVVINAATINRYKD